jgi:hypothetical protein
MGCLKPKIDKETGAIMFCCGSSWGIGVYKTYDPEYEDLYGYPPTDMNPYDYHPDPECCFPKEITAWEEAKKEWDKKNG